MKTQATISERRAAYDPAAIEPKWQQRWESDGLHRARIDPERKKHYFLTMLPYPSGDLHIGHWYAMTPSDARARYLRMQGYNVMYPIGFDSFGLPAENAAIKRNIHPKEWTYANIDRMRGQLRSMGAMWDWQREATSSDREYYRWTQWFFVKLLAHDLAYRSHAAVDFCPNCNTTVAREQVVGEERLCERCDTPVIKRDLEQWFLRITRYAEELLRFDGIDWPERIRTLQTNWIGRSEGAHVAFRTERGDALEVFTTRPTPCGAPPSWCWPPSIRWSPSSPRLRGAPRWRRTWPAPPARPTSNARRRAGTRAARSPAPTRSTRSTTRTFRSGSPTTC